MDLNLTLLKIIKNTLMMSWLLQDMLLQDMFRPFMFMFLLEVPV
jgi:hypothetical protein